MKPPVVLAVLIGTLVLACSTTTSAPAEPTPNIDATVEAKIAIIPTPTPQIVIQEVEVVVEKVVIQEVIKEIEVPVEVTVAIKKLIEMEAPVGLSLGPGAFLHCYGQDTPSYA